MTPEKKHLSRDPQLSSVTRKCQIYSTQMDSLKTFFQIERIPEFYHSKEELFVEQLMEFCFSQHLFERDTLR